MDISILLIRSVYIGFGLTIIPTLLIKNSSKLSKARKNILHAAIALLLLTNPCYWIVKWVNPMIFDISPWVIPGWLITNNYFTFLAAFIGLSLGIAPLLLWIPKLRYKTYVLALVGLLGILGVYASFVLENPILISGAPHISISDYNWNSYEYFLKPVGIYLLLFSMTYLCLWLKNKNITHSNDKID